MEFNKIKELKNNINELEEQYYEIQEKLWRMEKKYNLYRVLKKYIKQCGNDLIMSKWISFVNNNYDYVSSLYKEDFYNYDELFIDLKNINSYKII